MEEKSVLSEINKNLEQIIKLKTEGNSQFKNDISMAIELYETAKEKINEVEKIIKEDLTELGEDNEDVKQLKANLKRETVLVYSNLALCYFKNNSYEKSVELDLKIVTSLDTKFDKSYARLVQTYTKLDKMDNAVYHYILMRKLFTKDTLDKYTDIFNNLQTENSKFADNLKKMTTPPKSKSGSSFTYYITLLVIGLGWVLYKYFKSKPGEETVF